MASKTVQRKSNSVNYDMFTSTNAYNYYKKHHSQYSNYVDFEREYIKRFLETTSPAIRANFIVCQP